MVLKPAFAVAFCALLLTFGAAARAAGVTVKADLVGTGSSMAETNLGDLIADALQAATGADIALIPATEIRAEKVAAGDVDSAAIVETLRASSDPTDTVYTLHLTGAQVSKALERSVSRLPSGYDGFLQVAGLTFTYNATRDENSRIGLVNVGSKALDPTQVYTVATTRLLADGALGYFEIWDKSAASPDTNIPVSKALSDFVTAHSPLDYRTQGRINPR